MRTMYAHTGYDYVRMGIMYWYTCVVDMYMKYEYPVTVRTTTTPGTVGIVGIVVANVSTFVCRVELRRGRKEAYVERAVPFDFEVRVDRCRVTSSSSTSRVA